MNYFSNLNKIFIGFLVFWGFAVAKPASAQSPVTITGSDNVCLGDATVYIPSVIDASYTYLWDIIPATSGAFLSANSTGATVQWTTLGTATINLNIVETLNPSNVIYTGNLSVNVGAVPAPFITTNTELACQKLDERKKEGDGTSGFDDQYCQLVCAHHQVIYYANGNPGSNFAWEIIGGTPTTATGPSVNVIWGSAGTGQVKLIETTTFGCISESVICVEITQGPEAMFLTHNSDDPYTPVIEICRNGVVVVQDMSSIGPSGSPIISYLWNWGDDHQTPMSPGAAGSPASHAYENGGEYELTLTVVNACGCSSVHRVRVRVTDSEAPTIQCPRVVCAYEEAVYSIDLHGEDMEKNIACLEESGIGNPWLVEGGTITYWDYHTVKIIWDNVDPNVGFGFVKYQSCYPCRMISVAEVPVIIQEAAVIQGPEVVCVGEQYVYRLPKWPATEFNWSVSGPATISNTDQRNEIVVTVNGVGSIYLFVDFRNTVISCRGATGLGIEVKSQQVISGTQALCQGSSASYSLMGGAIGTWTLKDATNTIVASSTGSVFNYTFSTGGNYKLSATGSTFCPPQEYVIQVTPTPDPANMVLGPDRACAGIPVLYEAGNPIAGTTFEWQVSSGSTNATMSDQSYITFGSTPAIISVTRVTTDALACRSTPFDYFVDVAVPPLSISGPDTVCHSSPHSYAVNYTDGDHYEWSLDIPTLGSVTGNANTANPTIQWNIPPGSGQLVMITARVKKCNAYTIVTFPVYVRGIPSITGITTSANPICSGTPITLTVTTSDPVASPQYEVNWGPVTNNSLTYPYNTSGASSDLLFDPVVTIINPNGCIGNVTATGPTITVKPAPVALLSPAGAFGVCIPFSEMLTATETSGLAGTTSFTWGGTATYSPPPTGPTANVTGYGGAFVTAHNSVSGCSSTSNTVQFIEACGSGPDPGCAMPPISFSHSQECGAILLEVTSGALNGTWFISPTSGVTVTNLGGGVADASATVAGIYAFGYEVVTPAGCTVVYRRDVIVPYIPEVRSQILCNQPGNNYTVNLFDHSTVVGSGYTRSYYGPGGPITSSGLSATTTQAGGTTVTYYLVIDDPSGASPSCTTSVSVETPTYPQVAINQVGGFSPGCIIDNVFEFGYATPPGIGTIQTYLWNFGDGSSNASDGNPISKTYVTPSPPLNPYDVSLTITDEYGCQATDVMQVEVKPNNLKFMLNALGLPACAGDAVTLNAINLGSATPSTYLWHEQQTELATTTSNNYNVYNPGSYWVEVAGDYGCKYRTDAVAVDITQMPAAVINGSSKQCLGQSFTLRAPNYGPGYTYSWSGYGSGSGLALSQVIYTAGGPYTYYLTITHTASGCSVTSPAFEVTVSSPPSPPALSFNVTNCDPYELEINASGVSGTYNWSNGMSGNPIYTPFGGDYKVTLTDLNGCVVESEINTPKSLEEYMWVFPTGCFCVDDAASAYVIGPIVPFDYWEWRNFGGVENAGGGFMPPHPVSAPGNYTMMLNNGWCELESGIMYYGGEYCEKFGVTPFTQTAPNAIQSNNLMRLTPNPASTMVQVHFTFVPEGIQRNIEVVDMLGRSIQLFELNEDNGILNVDLKQYAAGMYQVIMRRDGKTVQTEKLSVTK